MTVVINCLRSLKTGTQIQWISAFPLKVHWLAALIFGIVPSCTTQQSFSTVTETFQINEKRIVALAKILTATEKVRAVDYGNVHCELIETSQFRGEKEKNRAVTKIEYWSHGNQYFRLDSKIIESNIPSKLGSRRRLIVSPEGFIQLVARSVDAPFTIVEWGDRDEGLSLLYGNFFLYNSVRCQGYDFASIELAEFVGLRQPEDILKLLKAYGLEPRKRKLISISSPDDRQGIEVKWMKYRNPITYESKMHFDVDHGVVLDYEASSLRDGSITANFKEKKEYEFERFKSIPSYSHYRVDAIGSSSGKYRQTIEIRTHSVDWEAVPLGVFSLEAQGLTSLEPQSVWSRRLWALFAGVLLFGIVYLIKRARNRAI